MKRSTGADAVTDTSKRPIGNTCSTPTSTVTVTSDAERLVATPTPVAIRPAALATSALATPASPPDATDSAAS
ncbi:MAG: hypothetical protein ACR2HP_10055 [Ilumatobacteraceae bacterium]